MYMYIYICIHHIYIYVYIYIGVYIDIYTLIYIYSYIQTTASQVDGVGVSDAVVGHHGPAEGCPGGSDPTSSTLRSALSLNISLPL